MSRIQCPCCGFYPYKNYSDAFFDVCPICFWVYEETSHDHPDKPCGGANGMLSLNEARRNYREFGASREGILNFVRAPKAYEMSEKDAVEAK